VFTGLPAIARNKILLPGLLQPGAFNDGYQLFQNAWEKYFTNEIMNS
jgi:hypothetical protein